jgi:aspartate racemase
VAERILGLVGGVGPESTLDYYRRLLDGFHARRGPSSHPRLLIDSLDGGELIPRLVSGDLAPVAEAVGAAIAQLAAGGAGLAMICSVATHQVYDLVAPAAPIPMLSIIETTVRAARAAGIGRPILFAPRVTVEGAFVARPFEAAGITLVRPDEGDRAWLNEIYLGELVPGIIRDETRSRLLELAMRLRDDAGADALILGGTELSLILPDAAYGGLPVLNAAAIHVAAALDWLTGGDPPAA